MKTLLFIITLLISGTVQADITNLLSNRGEHIGACASYEGMKNNSIMPESLFKFCSRKNEIAGKPLVKTFSIAYVTLIENPEVIKDDQFILIHAESGREVTFKFEDVESWVVGNGWMVYRYTLVLVPVWVKLMGEQIPMIVKYTIGKTIYEIPIIDKESLDEVKMIAELK